MIICDQKLTLFRRSSGVPYAAYLPQNIQASKHVPPLNDMQPPTSTETPCPQSCATLIDNSQKHPIVLFDGVCNLCNFTVDFILQHEPAHSTHFAPLQSATGKDLIELLDLPESLDGIVLIEAETAYHSSTAALRIARFLSFPWPLLFYLFILVPRPVRDAVYRWIARHRYQWFGKRDTCRMPTPSERARFLTDDVVETPPST